MWIDRWKAKSGQKCPECGGTETSEICSPVGISEYDIKNIGWLLECFDCDYIYSTMPF